MEKEVAVGLMAFSVDEAKAGEFKKELRERFDQIEWASMAFRFPGSARNEREAAIKETCQKYGASII